MQLMKNHTHTEKKTKRKKNKPMMIQFLNLYEALDKIHLINIYV